MKAKFVNEKFDKEKKPVGITSDEGIDQIIKSWQKKGIKFGWQFFEGDEKEKRREYLSKYHKYVEKYLNRLHEAGVPWDDMTYWGDHVDIKSYQISKGNWSLFHCITKEDAEMLVKVLENLTTGNQTFNISEEREHISLGEVVYRDADPEVDKWYSELENRKGEKRRTEVDFLDKIEKTRQKLKSIL